MEELHETKPMAGRWFKPQAELPAIYFFFLQPSYKYLFAELILWVCGLGELGHIWKKLV